MTEEEKKTEEIIGKDETKEDDESVPSSVNLSGFGIHSLHPVESSPKLKPKSKFGVAVPKRLNEPRLYYNSRHVNYDDLST